MDQTRDNYEEFTFDRAKIIANLMELIPKMKDLREKAEAKLSTLQKPQFDQNYLHRR